MLLKMTLFHFILWLSKPRQSFPGGSDGKESACNAGDPGSIPGLGRSPGEVNGKNATVRLLFTLSAVNKGC